MKGTAEENTYEADDELRKTWKEAFSKPFGGGPIEAGFEQYFGVDLPNYAPYCFIKNNKTVGIPSEFLPGKHISVGMACMQGPALPGWEFEKVLPTITEETCNYIKKQKSSKKPFFAFMSLTTPHTPLTPNKEYKGKSGLDSPYADLVMETDAMIGKVLETLEATGQAENTMVILTSDNGYADYIPDTEGLLKQGHDPSAWWRGYKGGIWEGGSRVPFIVRWPKVVKPGSKCVQTICLTDVMRTLADYNGMTLPSNVAVDSVSLRPLLEGKDEAIHDLVIHQSVKGYFAIRSGKWKLCLLAAAGSWWDPLTEPKARELGMPGMQLYDVVKDPSEKSNLVEDEPEVVKSLLKSLKAAVEEGRTTPGPHQPNKIQVDLWKKEQK